VAVNGAASWAALARTGALASQMQRYLLVVVTHDREHGVSWQIEAAHRQALLVRYVPSGRNDDPVAASEVEGRAGTARSATKTMGRFGIRGRRDRSSCKWKEGSLALGRLPRPVGRS